MSQTAPGRAVKKTVKKTVSGTDRKSVPMPKTLAQAQVDFTSEGSPPPGVVGAGIPPAKPDV